MRTTPLLGAVAALVVLTGAACAGQDEKSDEEVRDDLSAAFEDTGLSGEAADCLAELVIDEAGFDALRDVNLNDDEPSAELAEQIAAATVRAERECELEG